MEDASNKILQQTPENIQQLFDLCTRTDERLKIIQVKQSELKRELEKISDSYHEVLQKIVLLENVQDNCSAPETCGVLVTQLNDFDKRLNKVEYVTTGTQDRWRAITNFVVQLIWIILAAWVLLQLNLSAPPVP